MSGYSRKLKLYDISFDIDLYNNGVLEVAGYSERGDNEAIGRILNNLFSTKMPSFAKYAPSEGFFGTTVRMQKPDFPFQPLHVDHAWRLIAEAMARNYNERYRHHTGYIFVDNDHANRELEAQVTVQSDAKNHIFIPRVICYGGSSEFAEECKRYLENIIGQLDVRTRNQLDISTLYNSEDATHTITFRLKHGYRDQHNEMLSLLHDILEHTEYKLGRFLYTQHGRSLPSEGYRDSFQQTLAEDEQSYEDDLHFSANYTPISRAQVEEGLIEFFGGKDSDFVEFSNHFQRNFTTPEIIVMSKLIHDRMEEVSDPKFTLARQLEIAIARSQDDIALFTPGKPETHEGRQTRNKDALIRVNESMRDMFLFDITPFAYKLAEIIQDQKERARH